MKANELMVGDWLYLYGQPTQWCFSDYKKWGGEYGDKELSGWEPIPITPEILEKNGFVNIGDGTYQFEDRPYWFYIDFLKHQYGCDFDVSTYEYEDSEHRLKLYGIPDLHELQHTLRLCGIDKEITL